MILQQSIIGALAFLMSFSVSAAQDGNQQAFLEGFYAVPLLDGFVELAEKRVVFDTPSGTLATTEIETKSVNALSQYKGALEGLGWVCKSTVKKINCQLDNADLNISANKTGKVLTLQSRPFKKD